MKFFNHYRGTVVARSPRRAETSAGVTVGQPNARATPAMSLLPLQEVVPMLCEVPVMLMEHEVLREGRTLANCLVVPSIPEVSLLTLIVTFLLTTLLIRLWNICDGERTLSPCPI